MKIEKEILSFNLDIMSRPIIRDSILQSIRENKAGAIDLSFEDIGDEGVKILVKELKNNTSITEINLQHNRVTDIGLQYLIQLVNTQHHIKSIDLSYNLITDVKLQYSTKLIDTRQNINPEKTKHGEQLLAYIHKVQPILENYVEQIPEHNLIKIDYINHDIYLTVKFDININNTTHSFEEYVLQLLMQIDHFMNIYKQKHKYSSNDFYFLISPLKKTDAVNIDLYEKMISYILKLINFRNIEVSLPEGTTKISNVFKSIFKNISKYQRSLNLLEIRIPFYSIDPTLLDNIHTITNVIELIIIGNKDVSNTRAILFIEKCVKIYLALKYYIDISGLILSYNKESQVLDIQKINTSGMKILKNIAPEQNIYLKVSHSDIAKNLADIVQQVNIERIHSYNTLKFDQTVHIVGKVDEEIVYPLTQAISMSDSIISLDLDNITFGIDTIKILSNFIATNKILKTLLLNNNNIGDKGIKYISGGISLNTSITTLYINNNNFGPIGINYFANAMCSNKTIKFLDLSNNPFGIRDVHPLGTMIEKNNTLISIKLDHTSMNDTEFQILAYSFRKNRSIRNIDISYNPIGDEGIKIFAESIKYNVILSEIYLIGTQITDVGANILLDLWQKNPYIEKITIQYNDNISPAMAMKAKSLLTYDKNRSQMQWWPMTNSKIGEVNPRFNASIMTMLQIFEALKQEKEKKEKSSSSSNSSS